MEFIGLSTAVARIADCVRLDPHLDDSATAIGDISRAAADKFWQENNPKIEWARSFGIAALILNKALHNSNMPPQWMEFDKQKRFAVKNDAVKQEGIELLTHATGWGNREQGNYSLHFFNAITQGEDALEMPIARGLNDGLAPDGKMLRFLNIGFDRAELVEFLDKNQIGHNLTPSPAPLPQAAPAETTPLPVFKLTARPLCVPPELEAMSKTARIFIIERIGANSGEGTATVAIYLEQLRAIIKRQAQGYFTINEAAQIMADAGHGIEVEEFIGKMLNAFNEKESTFSIRNSDSKIPLDKDNFNKIRKYRHLVKSSDINDLLAKWGVDYRFPDATPEPQVAPVGAAGRPLQRTAAQDNAIICEIRKQGYDPLALPKNPTGKPGVKASIRTALSGNELFVGSTIFDKAWIRLAARADIVIKK